MVTLNIMTSVSAGHLFSSIWLQGDILAISKFYFHFAVESYDKWQSSSELSLRSGRSEIREFTAKVWNLNLESGVQKTDPGNYML